MPQVPELDDLVQFCKKNEEDIECRQFLRHTLPRKTRGGGGWAGVVKATLAILRKMEVKKC